MSPLTHISLLSLLTTGLARLDTLTASDYLRISVDCKDTRIKVNNRLLITENSVDFLYFSTTK